MPRLIRHSLPVCGCFQAQMLRNAYEQVYYLVLGLNTAGRGNYALGTYQNHT